MSFTTKVFTKVRTAFNALAKIRKPRVLDSIKTANFLLQEQCSLSRFGDGEFDIIFGKDLLFQKFDEQLKTKLLEVLDSTATEHSLNFKVAIPYPIWNTTPLRQESLWLWKGYHGRYGFKLAKLINYSYQYLDTQVTRFYMAFEDKSYCSQFLPQLMQLWEGQDLLFVEGTKSRLGIGNDLFDSAKSIKRILCPEKNAFEKYSEILENVRNHGENKLILIALGPTATALAYDLAKLGFWAIDVGHIDVEYSWMQMKAQKKKPVRGKYVNEAGGFYGELSLSETNAYLSSIAVSI